MDSANKHDRRKPTIVYVGAVSAPKDGTLGGQLFATQALFETPIAEQFEWLYVDSSQRSQPPPSIVLRGWSALRRVLRSTRMMLTRRVDAVFIFTPYLTASLCEKLLIASIGILLRKRVVVSVRSEIRPLGKVERRLRFVFGRVLARCTKIMCQSETAKSRLAELYPTATFACRVIPNWIDVSRYRMSELAGDSTDVTASDRRIPHLVYFGWLEEYKGARDLIAAATLLNKRGCRFRLSVCGSGSLHKQLMQEVQDESLDDHVTFHGWVAGEDKIAMLANADMLTLPSHSEGMPNAVLEAMSAGLPIVATRVGGIPDMLDEHDGGLLVDARCPAALADAIQQLLESPDQRTKMGRHNREAAEQRHDVDGAWRAIAAELSTDTTFDLRPRNIRTETANGEVNHG